jgi:geranylgeranyl reductase family protein
MLDFDVIIVGGGPAGTSAALKCSNLNLNVLLIEQERLGRHKPCGGILPLACSEIVMDELGKEIPQETTVSPEKLGLFYVPPSGRKRGGKLRKYELLNINRDLFDQWLCKLVIEAGVQIWEKTRFIKLKQSDFIQVLVKKDNAEKKITTRYLIGADGVYSKVRNSIYFDPEIEIMPVLQEHWKAKGDFDNNFYVFLRGDITPNYAYVIPKNNLFVVGIGVPKKHFNSISTCIKRFKNWIAKEYNFSPVMLEKREIWAIPYGFNLAGEKNVILTGDAAGFCNPFSGEGIRLALESGIAAGNAVEEARSNGNFLAPIYRKDTEWINHLINITYSFVRDLTDNEREKFVESELARIPFR